MLNYILVTLIKAFNCISVEIHVYLENKTSLFVFKR